MDPVHAFTAKVVMLRGRPAGRVGTIRIDQWWLRTQTSVLCDTAGIATDRPLVYGRRQGITQPASASNIPILRANPAQRCGARCVEDDPSRRTPERSSDDYRPPDRNSQCGNAVLDFPARRRQ